MKFLVDENVGFSLINFLRNSGYDTKSVSEFYPSRDDFFLINLAYKEERIIITNDKDFGFLIFNSKFPTPSVILLRFQQENSNQKIDAMKHILQFPKEKIYNHFIVISENKIRFRKIMS